MKKPKRYQPCSIIDIASEYMKEHVNGQWVRYSDVQDYIQDLIEEISLGWNAQLVSGGALLEEGSNDESKV